jgi:CRISPR system Cascade subunit CasE
MIVGDIQRLLGVLPAQMSRIIRSLENRDRPLIACHINPRDKRKVDVVMHALHPLSPEERSERREEITQSAHLGWMQRKGEAHGFSVEHETFQVVAHYRERIPRRNAAPALINCAELVGLLTITDPGAFGMCLSQGLGASRSFGCGLLEVARVN